jgi:type I restriction enzyme R subunit
MPLTPEQLAREKIDAQLAACGWVVQNYADMDFGAGRGIALREVPLKTGPCDYLLLVDRKAVGIVEAKKEGTTLSGVAEQAANYAANLPTFLAASSDSLPLRTVETVDEDSLFKRTHVRSALTRECMSVQIRGR